MRVLKIFSKQTFHWSVSLLNRFGEDQNHLTCKAYVINGSVTKRGNRSEFHCSITSKPGTVYTNDSSVDEFHFMLDSRCCSHKRTLRAAGRRGWGDVGRKCKGRRERGKERVEKDTERGTQKRWKDGTNEKVE